eukprot:GSMAST32.ASY1.ANO1.1344.1 assembled CDS
MESPTVSLDLCVGKPAPYYVPDIENLSNPDLIFMARLAEQCDRYEDMISYMNRVAESKGTLDVEERNLFSVAYKNVAGGQRASWRILTSLLDASEKDWEVGALLSYKTSEKLFYFKMCADYKRYQSEIVKSTSERGIEIISSARKFYEEAKSVSVESKLQPTSPMVLGLALNMSVFQYEIINDAEEACRIARESFDAAVSELDTLEECSYKDATLIMQLLRDNLTLWTEEQQSI